MQEKMISGNHRIVIENREKVELTGVVDVLAFDEEEIVLETDMGMMVIKGKGLHINRLNLDNGEVKLDGEVESLSYSENDVYAGGNSSFFSKLFKG